MELHETSKIKVFALIQANISEVWEDYNSPESILQWNYASDAWHCPSAENDLRIGGEFCYRMEDRDSGSGFWFGGAYNEIISSMLIKYTLWDLRQVTINFESLGNDLTKIMIEFEPDKKNSAELQQSGWQAILDNFKNFMHFKTMNQPAITKLQEILERTTKSSEVIFAPEYDSYKMYPEDLQNLYDFMVKNDLIVDVEPGISIRITSSGYYFAKYK